MYIVYEKVSYLLPYIPNPMCYFHYQKYGYTQQHCASTLVCGKVSCSIPPYCVNYYRSHTSNSKTCPSSLDEKAIQELWMKVRISFIETHKKLMDSKLKTASHMHQFSPTQEELMLQHRLQPVPYGAAPVLPLNPESQSPPRQVSSCRLMVCVILPCLVWGCICIIHRCTSWRDKHQLLSNHLRVLAEVPAQKSISLVPVLFRRPKK